VKVFFSLFLAGLLTLLLQGALAMIIPPPWCPDLLLLAVISIGLRWWGLARGLVLAYLLGFAADILSGSLVGSHALLGMLAFMSAVLAGRQLNLKGTLSLAVFGWAVSFFYGLALYAISSVFLGGMELSLRWLVENFVHASVNGLLTPLAFEIFSRLAVWAGADDSSERALYIETAGRVP
jgi:cell shape-determining protein MreD